MEVLARREARKVRRVLFRAAFSRGARTEAPKIPRGKGGRDESAGEESHCYSTIVSAPGGNPSECLA